MIKETSNGPTLTWVKIGDADLSHVEVLNGLDNEDTVFIFQAKAI